MVSKRHGFTLIELLVVIAIIAILAAILFPVFARAREKARQTSCLSNVKQLSLGLYMYAQDYDEKFPRWNWGERISIGGPPGMTMWYAAVFPYVKNQQLYTCPSVVRDGCHLTCYPAWSGTVTGGISYGYNEYIGNVGASMGSIQFPAQHVLLGDARAALGGHTVANILWRYAFVAKDPTACCVDPPPAGHPDASDAPHNGGSNIGFVDGHAKWINVQNLRVGTGELYY